MDIDVVTVANGSAKTGKKITRTTVYRYLTYCFIQYMKNKYNAMLCK